MIIRRIVRFHRSQTILRFNFPSETSSVSPHLATSCRSSLALLHFSIRAQNECTQPITTSQNAVKEGGKLKKPLSIHFKEAVGLLEKTPDDDDESKAEDAELKEKLKKLGEELRVKEDNLKNAKENKEDDVKRVGELFKNLSNTPKEEEGVKRVNQLSKKKSASGEVKSLSSLFVTKAGRDHEILKERKELIMENSSDYKPLTPVMEKFVIHLYENGYFRDSNFMPRNRFDITCFENSFAKGYIRFAAEQFGRDNREIAKWLSGSDLKKVASFGCPSLGKKIVHSAKGLRRFFGINESNVCNKCALKQSCKFVNQNGWKLDNKYLDLAMVMRVVPLYALESVPPDLVVPEEIKESVSQLLNEAVNLSKTVTSKP